MLMFLEDCKIGQKYEVPSILITKEDIIDFAKRYDNIPLHTDEEYAQTTRFKKIIASGMGKISGAGYPRRLSYRRKMFQHRMVCTSLCRRYSQRRSGNYRNIPPE